jgi:Ca2+-binding RTX toxin-like protein
VSVNYATADGTATAPGDYTQTSGTLSFAPLETTKTVTVQAKGDVQVEPDETFFVNLSSPANATIADNQGKGTVQDDDLSASQPCTIHGTSASDSITGTSGDDVICVGGGDDQVSGLGGRDVLIGGSGRDLLLGGEGSDLLLGDQGSDSLRGEGGQRCDPR